jgi:hypothetical protein
MALRGTGFAKRAVGAAPARSDASTSLPGEQSPTRVVPLDLIPLLLPYRGQGRISLRVERLPHRTRLSRGQNNGDRSWSLSLDELDGLNYLAPDNLAGPQTLSIRIVNLDGGDGATIAVIEHIIPAVDGAKMAAIDGDRSFKVASTDYAAVAELRRELAEAKATLTAKEAEFADLRRSLETEWKAQSERSVESELAAARAAWESELNSRLAAIAERNETDTQWHRKSWQSEQDARLAEAKRHADQLLEQERERSQRDLEAKLAQAQTKIDASETITRTAEEELRALSARLQTNERARHSLAAEFAKTQTALKEAEAVRLADAQARWQAQFKDEQEQTRERQRKEFEVELALARNAWQERETTRLADARAEWQVQSEKTISESRDRATREVEALHAGTRAERLKEEAARLVQVEAAWRQQLASAVADARARAAKDAEAALEQAQRAWKANEVARFDAAEALWREESAKLIADARARAASAGKPGQDDQVNRLQDELALAHASLANRDAELARARAEVEAAGERARSQVATALSEAQSRWSAEEAARHAAAEAAWREQSAKVQSSARDETSAAADLAREELRRAGEELALARAAIAERDERLAEARQANEAEAENLREQNETALSEARRAWQIDEEARLTEAEESWRAQYAASLAEQTPPAAPEPAPGPTEPLEDDVATRNKVEILRLRGEVERLKSLTAVRDVELAQARASAERARARLTGELHDDSPRLKADHVRISRGRSLPERKTRTRRPLWRDMSIVAAVAAFVILLYPHIVALLPYDWVPGNSYADEEDPVPTKAPAARPHRPAAAPIQPTDVVIRSANVRSGPAKTESLVTTLASDVAVVTVERRGSWAHIQFPAADGKPHDGWVFNTFLKATPAPAIRATSVP